MLTIGLTGGIGSGKSYVSSIFEQKGISIIDADVVARHVVEPGTAALNSITQHFIQYPDILLTDGALNRAKLRDIIFRNQEEKSWLEQLLHPLIRTQIQKKLQQTQSAYTILVSPLLLETNQKDLCDKIIVVDLTENEQLSRASLRDKNSPALIKKIIDSQMSREKRLTYADYVINNQDTKEQTHQQINQIHDTLLSL